MDWIVLAYSLPASKRSGPRVTLWRRLRRLGAVSPTGGVYILPAREACMEAFQWLLRELQQAGGTALLMHVSQFDGLTDEQLIGLFHDARTHDYAELETQVAALEQRLPVAESVVAEVQDALTRLQRRYGELRQVDYFDAPAGRRVAARLSAVQQALMPRPAPPAIVPVSIEEYRTRRWVTRPRPHVDRLACIWLIRRFINPDASIRYGDTAADDEIAFDMTLGGHFGHEGNLCTFEVMLIAFALRDPALALLADIVHEIDLRDGRSAHPETAGVDAVLAGWHNEHLSDTELETRGLALFGGLYVALSLHRGNEDTLA